MGTLNPLGLDRFCAALEATCGLSYTREKEYLFNMRLRELVSRYEVPDYETLTGLFLRDGLARREITEALVTSETYFFRDENTFAALPGILQDQGASSEQPVVVWSLGCATGQEAYSILMGLREDGRLPTAAVRIYGLDISRKALTLAREGVYTPFEVGRGLREDQVRQHMTPDAGGWRVAASLRELPIWIEGNLLEGFDLLPRPNLVFCRNVLIYFEDAVKRRVVGAIIERLWPGGLLVLSNSEHPMAYVDLVEPVASGQSFYRRVESVC